MDLGPAIQQPTGPPTSPAPLTAEATAGTHAAPRPRRAARLRAPGNWPLLAVLAVQAALSLRLVGANTAFQDEALYLWAGHLEWARLLHGTPVPPFPSYFSGAPVIYPPLAALADSAGGLAAARILSLLLMLGATTLLWAAARLLSGRRAAFFAAALFAVLGPTLHLGSFATYDAMSLFLLALASWLVIRAGDRPERDRLDGRRRGRAGTGQRDLLPVGPIRPRGARARPPHRVAQAGRQACRGTRADPPGRPGRPDHAGVADRR